MTYIKLCPSSGNVSTLLNILKSLEGKTSNKVITEKFLITNDDFIEIKTHNITRMIINTIKWIDDILDKYTKHKDIELKMIISNDKKLCINSKDFNSPFIIINPPNDLIFILKKWSLIKNIKNPKNKNYIGFDFNFYSKLKYSKTTKLKTKNGIANIQTVEVKSHNKLFTIFSVGKIENGIDVRVHYMCETSEIFDSIHCDCKEQLDKFKSHIFKNGGILIYAHEEGRGFGLTHKINAYYNTEHLGLDTVDAMIKETGKDESRMFEIPADIIFQLGLKKINIWTNNPLKINPFLDRGIDIKRKALWINNLDDKAKKYIIDKKKKMSHYEDNN